MTDQDTDSPDNRRALVVCDQWLGSNGFAGMKALRRAGWSVLVLPEWEYVPVKWRTRVMRVLGRAIRRRAVEEFNNALRQAAVELQPAMLLVFKGTFVLPDTLRFLRTLNVRCYCYFPDVSAKAHGPFIPEALPAYDMVFTTKSFGIADMQSLGVRHSALLLHAFDPDLHRPISLTADEHARYDCDVSFIGTWSPKKESILAGLKDRMPDVHLRVWGAQWEKATAPALIQAVEGRAVEGMEYVKAIAGSAVNLGLLSEQRPGASSGDQVTSRTFHIPATGGFMLHERTAELLSVFEEGESVACFGDLDELTSALVHFLREPERRAKIAQSAKRVVDNAHSWDHRMREILTYHESRQSDPLSVAATRPMPRITRK